MAGRGSPTCRPQIPRTDIQPVATKLLRQPRRSTWLSADVRGGQSSTWVLSRDMCAGSDMMPPAPCHHLTSWLAFFGPRPGISQGSGPSQNLIVVVLVPAQWIGDWETGHARAGIPDLWYAPLAQLYRLSDWVTEATSYRPDRLPDSATGPRQRRAVRSPRARLPR